jgi:RimJ/RimL family protein N-acetyltransferase
MLDLATRRTSSSDRAALYQQSAAGYHPSAMNSPVRSSRAVVLETERLVLRHLTAQDSQALDAVLGDPIAMRWYPRPFTRAEVEEWVARNVKRYRDDGHGLWAMELKSTGEMVGDCGLVAQEVDGERLIEVAYHVRRDHWGRGYATEAARACMRHAFDKLGAERVISLIKPGNQSSWRVAEKNGMRVWKQTTKWGDLHLVYAMRREEFNSEF